MRHEGVPYCFQCKEYPCERYARINERDSFITYLHVPSDMETARASGLESYLDQLSRKSEILDTLLDQWDNGRLKSFFCLAVNLLPLASLETAMARLNRERTQMEGDPDTNPATYGSLAKETFNQIAASEGIELKLRR
jgi:hypothetical protein